MTAKPKARVTGSYTVLANGKVLVHVTSNAKKVKVSYRTVKNKKASATITIHKGSGSKTLAKGSTRIYAQAKATSKLRASSKIALPADVAPPVDTTPPGPVTGLRVTAMTATSISLAWVNPSSEDLASVIVRRATGSTPPASASAGTGVALPTATATSVTDTGLNADTSYAYAVFTRDKTGNTGSAGAATSGRTQTNRRSDTLRVGESLRTDDRLTSPNGNYTLVMQSDCNLVVYQKGGGVPWNSGTGGRGAGCHADMQSDGNLVVYTAAGVPAWSATTNDFRGTELVMQDDGNLVLYQNGRALWSNGGTLYDRLLPGWTLKAGESLTSVGHQYQLVMQSDGNLVVYRVGGAAQWAAGTNRPGGNWTVMQSDGNLVVYTSANTAVWNSGTAGHPGAHLVMQSDGNLVVYLGSSALWSTQGGPSTTAIDRFVANNKGKTLANAHGTYPGECVSLVSQFLLQVHGITTGTWGNAIDYRSGGTGGRQLASRGFTWHTDTSFRNGDIIVWGDDPGTTTGVYGHVAVWYNNRIFDQNWAGRRYADLHAFFTAGYLGYWRK